MGNKEVIQRLWELCNLLRDEGLTDVQLLDEISYMLCIKMINEKNIMYAISWDDSLFNINKNIGKEFIRRYNSMLERMEDSCDKELRSFFYAARSNIREARHLEMLLMSIKELDLNIRDEIIEFYDSLTYKCLYSRTGGQHLTPQVLSKVLVKLLAPQRGEECNDPACGSFRFMIDAYEYVRRYNVEEGQQELGEISKCFFGTEINPLMYRVSIVKALLHGIAVYNICNGDAFREEDELGIQRKQYDVIISDPPMGGRVNTYAYFGKNWLKVPTSNFTLNFLQYIYHCLKIRQDEGARAAVIVPDGILSDSGAGKVIRSDMMDKCNVHTILRLPRGILHPYAVVLTNVLFFNRGKDEKENTKEIYFYDMRTDMPKFDMLNPVKYEHFENFIQAYQADDRTVVQDERWTCYTREEIRHRDDTWDLGLMEKDIDLSLEKKIDPVETGINVVFQLKKAAELIESVIEEL